MTSDNAFIELNYQEVIIPSIWEQETFIQKAGNEILGQMYVFADKSDRDCCLIPEVTAIIQNEFKTVWDKCNKKPMRIFYCNRCYRYERPQLGRYREFTQFGVELLGNKEGDKQEIIRILDRLMKVSNVSYEFSDSVKRGLDYYIEDGFEVSCEQLGAQKQVAGGGRYDCGIGFAIGIDRLALVS